MFLLDVFIEDKKIILWCKESGRNYFLADDFKPVVYFEPHDNCAALARSVLVGISVEEVVMKQMMQGDISVFKLTFASVADFKKRFGVFEGGLRGKGVFYNADIELEEMYLFEKGLYPFCKLSVDYSDELVVESITSVDDYSLMEYEVPELSSLKLKVNYDRASKIKSIECNGILIEEDIIKTFIDLYARLDPDVIIAENQQERIFDLFRQCKSITSLHLNRIGKDNLDSVDGFSYFSYGVKYYRERHRYLRGRFLLNSGSFMDSSFTLYSLIEGARVCRMRLQKIATHSVGRAVTNLLTYEAYQAGCLIPYQIGVYERIKSFSDLVSCDRGALTLEPYVGMHRDVCELDFVSMYPSIISEYNLSPETLYCNCCKDLKIADTPYHFCKKVKGTVPRVCDILLSRRAYFKTKKDYISVAKADYIKWLLVVIFGFQAYRNKKIGCIEVHEAINALARHSLMKAIRVAEAAGYEVIHGIVDSLYVRKKDVSYDDGVKLASLIYAKTRLPIEVKAVYRFITFLPSVVNTKQPVPTAYYGVSEEGKVKVRGIELRQRTAPLVVKNLQKELINELYVLVSEHKHIEVADIRHLFNRCVSLLRNHLAALDYATADDLAIKVRIGREKYKVNCAQKILVDDLRSRGITVHPGQSIRYIIEDAWYPKYCIVDDYTGKFDRKKYELLLKKAFLHLFLPFGLTLCSVEDLLLGERQESLLSYSKKEVLVSF